MQTAVNPTTGETAVLVGSEWKKAEQVATNPAGQKAYLVGGAWMTEPGQDAPPVPAPAAGPTTRQAIQASVPGRILQGARDAVDAGAQMLPRGLQAATSLFGLVPNSVSDYLGAEAKRVDKMTTTNEAEYQAARKATGSDGIDVSRIVGNVVSPVNAALAYSLPLKVAGKPISMTRGAVMGGAGGALTPLANEQQQDNFATAKAAQTGIGAAAGAVLAPVAGKIAQWVSQRAAGIGARAQGVPGTKAAWDEAQTIINRALVEANQSADDIPQPVIQGMRQQVFDALNKGRKLDPAALLREADFKALNIQPTQGQLTRDATQFARERNLRAVQDVGQPLMDRFTAQNQRMQDLVRGLGGPQAAEPQQAGARFVSSLKDTDAALAKQVTGAYQAARDSSGKEMAVPLQGLAQDYAQVLRDFGDKVPSGVRNNLDGLGLLSGRQQKTFSIEDADRILKVINDNWSTDKATNTALSKLSQSVKAAVTGADGPDVYAPARQLAAQRFRLQEMVPALQDASRDAASADKFVSRYLVGGETKDVQALADLLKKTSMESFSEARNQMAAVLQRSAFGTNQAGDKIITPDRYADELRRIGSAKLGAFFSPDEIAQMKTLGRVAAYVNSQPAASPVLGNPNMAWAGPMLASIGNRVADNSVAKMTVSLGQALGRIGRQSGDVAAALRPSVPSASSVSPETQALIAQLLAGGSFAGGAAATPDFRKKP